MKYIKIFEDYIDNKPTVSVENNNKDIQNTIDVFKDKKTYKEYIDLICNKLNVKAKNLLNYGTRGVAVELEDNKVLKITNDLSELLNSYNIVGNNDKHIVNIYSANYITPNNIQTNDKSHMIGVIVMEKLEIVSKEIKGIMFVLADSRNSIHSAEILQNDIIENKEEIADEIEDMCDIKCRLTFYEYFPSICEMLDEMHKRNLSVYDFGSPDNYGFDKNGNLKIFDIGYHTLYNNYSDIPRLIL